MTINIIRIIRDRKAYAQFAKNEQAEIERNYRMKSIISNASKNGMK